MVEAAQVFGSGGVKEFPDLVGLIGGADGLVQVFVTGGFGHQDAGVEGAVGEGLVEGGHQGLDFGVVPGTTLLPFLPFELGLVDGADVGEREAFGLEMGQYGSQEGGVVVVAVVLQVGALVGAGVVAVGSAVFRVEAGRTVHKGYQLVHAVAFGFLEEPLLTGLLGPVVAAVGVEEALHPAFGLFNIAGATLFGAAGPDVEPPARQANALGVAGGREGGGEELLGDGFLLG